MELLLLLAVVFAVGIVLYIFSNEPKNLNDILVNPYVAKKPLTPTEVIFYNKLKEALPQFIVLPQVQLASFISVNKTLIKPNETFKWQNPISQQSVDYLLCKHDFIGARKQSDRFRLIKST